MFDPGCRPEEYQSQGKEYNFPNLTKDLCPQCKKVLLKLHGFYSRWLDEIDFSGEILIRRYLCNKCGKTVSLLPSFAHPKMAYGMKFIVTMLVRFFKSETSLEQFLKTLFEDTGLSCSRQLLRLFRIRFEKNLNRLIMEATALLRPKTPIVTVPEAEKRKRARQFLEYILSFDPEDVSRKLFERSGTTFLGSLAK
jgi:hypothetical protein